MTDDPVKIATKCLIYAPEQSDWSWEDHCEGLAEGILTTLHNAGWRIVRTSNEFNDEPIAVITDEWAPDRDGVPDA